VVQLQRQRGLDFVRLSKCGGKREADASARKLARLDGVPIPIGDSGQVNAQEGFRAYQVTDRNGTVTLKVPDLNLYSAVIQRPDGHYQALSNIDLAEPPNEFFRPPTNAVVTYHGLWKDPVPVPVEVAR
jgi:hypothetical protein